MFTFSAGAKSARGLMQAEVFPTHAGEGGRHAIRHRHVAYACLLRGEVGRRRVGPRGLAHRLRLLAPAMS